MRFALVFALILIASCQQHSQFSSMKKIGNALDFLEIKTAILQDQELQNAFQSESEGRGSYRLMAKADEATINIDFDSGLDEPSFKKYKAMIEEQFFGNFHSRFAPYPGEITKRVVCSLDFYPIAYHLVLKDGLTATFYRTYVNARQAWGVCEKEEIAGVRYWGLIYVPQKKLLMNIKFTYPKDKEDGRLFFDFVKGLSFR